MEQNMEANVTVEEIHPAQPGGKRAAKGGRKGLIALLVVLVLLVGGYLGFCAWVESQDVIWSETYVLGQNLGGMTVEQAASHLDAILPELGVAVYLQGEEGVEAEPAATVKLVEDLGVKIDAQAMAWTAENHHHVWQNEILTFLTAGWRYVTHTPVYLTYGEESFANDEEKTGETARALTSALSYDAQGTAYVVTDHSIDITAAKDGCSVTAKDMTDRLNSYDDWQVDLAVEVPRKTLPAKVLSAQEIYDAEAGEMKNAAYDIPTASITPEQRGLNFNVAAAQAAINGAEPGETVSVAAEITYPTLTAEKLKEVLFRDVLGEYRTHVSGTAARINNVKLSASTINGYVMNPGDVFSYNEVVGQRTAANGYQAAPAYVQGETVDEIGGGICQTSSTLYYACLLSQVEIVERYAHRYVPAYIPWGMDATVSWGGPDYKFANDTEYPIKIETVYSKNYLTVRVVGTKTDDTYVKMTNEVLSTTPWETVYEVDETLAPGTPETVKTTPYTGYKVNAYRNVYDGEDQLISSTLETTSNYKVRNKVIVQAPKAVTEQPQPDPTVEKPAAGPVTDVPAETAPAETETPPAETPVTETASPAENEA